MFWQPTGRYIDLDLNRQGLDADEREGFEFGEHTLSHKPALENIKEAITLGFGPKIRKQSLTSTRNMCCAAFDILQRSYSGMTVEGGYPHFLPPESYPSQSYPLPAVPSLQ